MAKTVTIAGATYQNVPSIVLNTPDGGTAKFIDEDEVQPSGETYPDGDEVSY